MKTRVVQKAVVLNDAGEVLMLRRGKTDTRRPMQWDLPGGLREENEELLAGVEREITEETGLSVTDLSPVYAKTEIRTWNDGKTDHTENVVFIFYTAKTASKNVKLSSEHDHFEWQPIKRAIVQFEYYLHKELIQYLLDNKLL